MFLSGYNIEWKAVFVLGSCEKFLALHFHKLPKFHSDINISTFLFSKYLSVQSVPALKICQFFAQISSHTARDRPPF